MARLDVVGFNEAVWSMEVLAKIPDSVMRDMLDAQADVVVEAQRRSAQSMLQGRYYKGAVAAGVAKGKYKRKKDGAEQSIIFKGKQHGNRVAEIAFVNEYGTKSQPARPFILTANEQSAGDVVAAGEAVLAKWQDKQ